MPLLLCAGVRYSTCSLKFQNLLLLTRSVAAPLPFRVPGGRCVGRQAVPVGNVTTVEQIDWLPLAPGAIVRLIDLRGVRAGPFELRVSRCERALQLAAGQLAPHRLAANQSGAVFLMHVVAVVSKPQLAVLDPDTLDVVQIAAGEADELTFDMGRAGALDFQPPGPPARRMVYSDVPTAVEARVRGPGRRGQQQENSEVAEHDCLRINLSYARFQPAVRHIRE